MESFAEQLDAAPPTATTGLYRLNGSPRLGVVAIGRNEGPRLQACLASIASGIPTVFVDSGSTDDSVATASACGARVVELDRARDFTAARARNTGLAALTALYSDLDYVQFVDGDCEMRQGWLADAVAFLDDHPAAAVACGRNRERYLDASVYNRLCDAEWDTPVGSVKACGGNAMMRLAALRDAGNFRESLIAGEEPELCIRLRQKGWEIWRLDREMTWHDAAMTRFAQWWRRSRRAGYAFAEGSALHGAAPERHWVKETRRAVAWAFAPPAAALGIALFHPTGILMLLVYPLQVVRLAVRDGVRVRANWWRALLTVIGRFAEGQGALEFHVRRVLGRGSRLIEYK